MPSRISLDRAPTAQFSIISRLVDRVYPARGRRDSCQSHVPNERQSFSPYSCGSTIFPFFHFLSFSFSPIYLFWKYSTNVDDRRYLERTAPVQLASSWLEAWYAAGGDRKERRYRAKTSIPSAWISGHRYERTNVANEDHAGSSKFRVRCEVIFNPRLPRRNFNASHFSWLKRLDRRKSRARSLPNNYRSFETNPSVPFLKPNISVPFHGRHTSARKHVPRIILQRETKSKLRGEEESKEEKVLRGSRRRLLPKKLTEEKPPF